MPIVVNELDEFLGAATRIEPPITSEDCTNFPSFELLCKAEQAAGNGCTIRSAVGWATRTVAEIETDCEAV